VVSFIHCKALCSAECVELRLVWSSASLWWCVAQRGGGFSGGVCTTIESLFCSTDTDTDTPHSLTSPHSSISSPCHPFLHRQRLTPEDLERTANLDFCFVDTHRHNHPCTVAVPQLLFVCAGYNWLVLVEGASGWVGWGGSPPGAALLTTPSLNRDGWSRRVCR
jgi:hypothetical protein